MNKRLMILSVLMAPLVIGTLVIAGCGATTADLTTGSLFGAGGAPPGPAPETPSMRGASVAAVSARAAKCGYNFDPARLKSGFLSYEMAQGASVQEMAKIEGEYDTIRAKVAATIAAEPDFCNENKTRTIKADLTKYLSGDYSLPIDQKKIDERLLANAPRAREVFNQEYMKDKTAPKTKRVEEE